jgi:hypothetical protein
VGKVRKAWKGQRMRAYRRTRYILILKWRRENNIERRRLGVKGIRKRHCDLELNVGYLFK